MSNEASEVQPARRCTATRANGAPCQAWAQRDSDPPRCVAHRAPRTAAPRTAAAPSEARVTQPAPVDIEHVIEDLAKKQWTLSKEIDRQLDRDGKAIEEIINLFALHGLNASRLGRLLRDKRALSGAAADGITGAIAQALDELSTELGADL